MSKLPILVAGGLLTGLTGFLFYNKNKDKTKITTDEVAKTGTSITISRKDILDYAKLDAIKNIKKREGLRLDVYKDTLGNKTVGYGHLTNLELGEKITGQEAENLLSLDVDKAFKAGVLQAERMKQFNSIFISALTSVNFQLGTNWTKKFYETYPLLVKGDYKQAIINLRLSLWYRQTPVRVEDFIKAIERVYN